MLDDIGPNLAYVSTQIRAWDLRADISNITNIVSGLLACFRLHIFFSNDDDIPLSEDLSIVLLPDRLNIPSQFA